MKRKTVIVLLAMFLIALSVICFVACKPSQDCKHEWDKWQPKPDGHYHVCKICKTQSKTYIHSFDDYILTADGYQRTCKLCKYVDKAPKEIEYGDAAENERLNAEINDKLNKFGNQIEKSDSLSYVMQLSGAGQETAISVKAKQSPVYIEMSANGNLVSVIKEENGKIFNYSNQRNNYFKKILLGDASEYEPSEDMPAISFAPNINIKTDACNIAYQNGTYTIKTYYKDLIDENLKNQLDQIFNQIDLDINILYNAVVTVDMSVTDDYVDFSVEIAINIGSYTEPQTVTVTIAQIIDLSNFKQVDFADGQYKVLNPTSIDEVYELTDISNPIKCDSSTNVFKIELNKGQYVIKTNYRVSATICPVEDVSNQRRVLLVDDDIYINKNYAYAFTVENSGQYYITFEQCANDTYEIMRCEYNDVFDTNNPKTIQETISGVIEGEYDLEYYAYTGEKGRLLTLTNTSENAIQIICKEYKEAYYYTINKLEQNESLNIYVGKGENKLFVCNPDANKPVNYSLSTSFYDNDNGSSTEFDEMPWITEEFSDDYYMAGFGFEDKYVRLHVNVKGKYDFEFDNLFEDSFHDLQITVFDKDMNYVDNDHYALEVGDYILKLTNNDHILGISKIKYVMAYTAEDFETDITLNTVLYEEIDSDKTIVEQQKVISNQKVTYRFKLENESVVMFSKFVSIYKSDGTLLTFGNYYKGAIKLQAGDYYFIPNADHDYYVRIAIVSDYKGAMIEYGKMPTLPLNVRTTFTTNELGVWYALVEIDKDGKYIFDVDSKYHCDIYLYDEQLNIIQGYDTYELTAGKYYICLGYEALNEVSVTLNEVLE